jgi:hypothetical protein
MLTKPAVLGLEGGIPAIEWPQHRSVDRPEVGVPSAFPRLDMAGPAGGGFPRLKDFSQVILVDKANLAFMDYDLYFERHG